ncbi:MAG: VWA domain-containing protein [Planctomycetales bacterium]|nr:VWA domain-containing protein [Planctomycetales bacterium]
MPSLFPHRLRRDRRGAMLILIAICLPIFLIMLVLSIDVAYMQLSKTELRTATDAAARAGSRMLSMTQDVDAARAEAVEAASRNLVAGAGLQLDDGDIEIGFSSRPDDVSRFEFTTPVDAPNSVRVTGRRTSGSLSGPVNLLVGSILGTSQFQPTHQAVSTQIDRDIALVIDRSGSMTFAENSTTFPPGWSPCDPPPLTARWYDVVRATEAFLEELEDTPQTELVGLASYNETGRQDHDLDEDYTEIRDAVDDITQNFCGGSTGIGRGMIEGLDIVLDDNFNRPFASKVLVVLTDGNHNTGVIPETIARQAADQDVIVFTVTFSNQADQARMQRTADIGGGKHFHAPTGDDLVDVFREIAKTAANLITE